MNMTVQISDKGNVIIQFLKRVTLTKKSYQTCSYHFHLSLKKKKQLISKRAYNFKIMSLHMCLIKYKKCDISRFKYHMYGTKIVANPH